MVTLRLLSTPHPWISWLSTACHTSVNLHSSPVDQRAEYSWSHFCYSPIITRGTACRSQLVKLLLLCTHHPWVRWQSTAGHTSVTLLHSPPVDQLAEHSWSHLDYSLSLITRGSEYWQSSWQSWSHFCYSPLFTRGSAGRAQLDTILLLSTHHPWVSWQSTAGHTSATLHSSPVDHWSHFCYSALITRHTSVTLHSSPVDQLAEHSWSHFCYSPLITSGSAGRVSWHTSITHLSPVNQLAEHSWSHFCYSPLITGWQSTAHFCCSQLITRGAGRAQLVTAGHTSVTLHSSPVDQLAEHAGHTSVTLLSSPMDQLAEHSWLHFCYSPFITRGTAGRVLMVTLLLLSTHHPWISWQSRAGHTSVTLHSSPVDQLAEHSWTQFCYSPLITRGSAGRAQLVTILLVSWQSTAGHTAGHTSVTLHSSPVDQLAEQSWSYFDYSPHITRGQLRAQLADYPLITRGSHWSHFCYSPLITSGSASRVQLVTLLLLSTHHQWIS